MAFLCYYAELLTCDSHCSVQTLTNGSTVSSDRNISVRPLKEHSTHQSAITLSHPRRPHHWKCNTSHSFFLAVTGPLMQHTNVYHVPWAQATNYPYFHSPRSLHTWWGQQRPSYQYVYSCYKGSGIILIHFEPQNQRTANLHTLYQPQNQFKNYIQSECKQIIQNDYPPLGVH
jgi:hypothetical protein